jgi:hypothetical protein
VLCWIGLDWIGLDWIGLDWMLLYELLASGERTIQMERTVDCWNDENNSGGAFISEGVLAFSSLVRRRRGVVPCTNRSTYIELSTGCRLFADTSSAFSFKRGAQVKNAA